MRRGLLLLLVLAAPAMAGSKYPYKPSQALTPGVIATTDTKLVCEKDYPARSRYVTNSTKNKVYALHKVDKIQCVKGCKIDHLIPLSIGGSNDIQNLWPHEYGADWTVFEKTRLEVRLRKEVCGGKLPIGEAQQCVQQDWTKCFLRFYPKN